MRHVRSSTRLRASLGVAAVSALVMALTPASTAAAQQESRPDVTPIGNDTVCPPPGAQPANAFADDDGSVHEENIDCAAQYDIVEGLSADRYGPTLDVTRAQMATFIVNEVETALGEQLPEGEDAFTDDEGSVHEVNINKLANADIVLGIGGDQYDPTENVNRAQMATFVSNAIDFHDDRDATNDSVLPTDVPDFFTDDEGSTHELSINRLASQGIVQGVSEDIYAPMNDVARAQMATFIIHAAELAARIGLFAPVPLQEWELQADLMPLNDSGATGDATVAVNEDGSVTVRVEAQGVEADQVHPQHIHGFQDETQNAVCPGPDSRDQIDGIPEEADNPDQYTGLEEGADDYGPVLLPLTTPNGGFPTPTDTTYTYERTFPAAELGQLPPLDALENRVIVLHGLTVDNGSYIATLPIACGELSFTPRTLTADLTTLNDSGATGTALVTVTAEGAVTVRVEAQGVEAGKLHPQHIHGFDDETRNAVCPGVDSRDQIDGIPEEADDPDRYTGLEEGADEYGPVLLPLTREDGTFPQPTDTTYVYERTFEDDELAALPPLDQLEKRAIVLHGMTVDNGSYIPTLPIACGQLDIETQLLTADLTSLNDSGATGTATVTVDREGDLTVRVEAQGVEAGKVHPQHIHGFDDASQNATCPGVDSRNQIAGIPEEADDPDQYTGLEEGADEYGPVKLALTQEDGSFPQPSDTTYVYERTFSDEELEDLGPFDQLENRAIVLHGLTVDNGTYIATLPIACGQLAPDTTATA